MREFKAFHPLVNLIYFVCTIGFSCFFMHPVCLAISLVCAFVFSAMQKKDGSPLKGILFVLPLMLLTALINAAFNHEGVTILAYLPSGNPLTAESVIYGVCAAVMLASVLFWFSGFNAVMTSDKIIYFFGRTAFSLVISMTLRFVPRFIKQAKAYSEAQKCIGAEKNRGVLNRIRSGLRVLSALIGAALENSIETSDSMRARGCGLPGRTAFSNYRFKKSDAAAIGLTLLLSAYTLAAKLCGGMEASFFPIAGFAVTPLGISGFVSYFALCAFPIFTELAEVIKWRALKSKI